MTLLLGLMGTAAGAPSNVSLAIATSAEASSDANLLEEDVLAITTSAEASSASSLTQRTVLSVGSSAEVSSAANLLAEDVLAISVGAEASSSASLVPRIVAAITSSAEVSSDSALAQASTNVTLAVASGIEVSSDATLDLLPPPVVAPQTFSGGKAIRWDVPKGIDPASYVFHDDTVKALRKPRIEKRELVHAGASEESDSGLPDDLLAVFAAFVIDEESE